MRSHGAGRGFTVDGEISRLAELCNDGLAFGGKDVERLTNIMFEHKLTFQRDEGGVNFETF